MDLELESLAHRDEHVDHGHRGLDPFGGLHGDVVVHDVVGEVGPQLVRVPTACCRTEIPDDLFGAGHDAPLLGTGSTR
jgi:hypothetical protein